MGKKSAPPPQDYAAAAQQTAASEKAAQTTADWANRPTQVDMYGNTTSWSAVPVKDPTTGLMTNQWTQRTQLSPQQQQQLYQQQALESGMMNQAGTQLGQVQSAYSKPMDTSGLAQWAQAPQAQNLNANAYQTGGAGQGMMQGINTDRLGGMMSQLNTGSLGNMPQADAQERQRIENAMFERMAPQHQQSQQALEAKLGNMGLTRGSEAWNREMQRIGDQQSRERYNAMEVGGNEMQRLHGMQMQGRQQGWQELLGAGQFQNQAREQGFQELLSKGNFANQAQQQAFNQNMGANVQNFDIAARGGAQNFDQQQQAANFQNQLRQAQFGEAATLRQQPMEEMNALLYGNKLSSPEFAQFTNSRAAGDVDYTGAANAAYNQQADAYNAKQAQRQGTQAAVGTIASAAIIAF
jgi:hypothetical protein